MQEQKYSEVNYNLFAYLKPNEAFVSIKNLYIYFEVWGDHMMDID